MFHILFGMQLHDVSRQVAPAEICRIIAKGGVGGPRDGTTKGGCRPSRPQSCNLSEEAATSLETGQFLETESHTREKAGPARRLPIIGA